MSNKIQEIPCHDRPRERLIKYGPESLADSELLSLILRSGGPEINALDLSQNLLTEFRNVHGLLYADLNQLRKIKYLGTAKICSIRAIGELSRRSLSPEELNRPKLDEPKKAYELIRPYIIGKKVECLYLISLDINHRLIKYSLVSLGSLNQSLADVREILRCALLNDAVSIVLIHNHPSGNLEPSTVDINTTRRLADACVKTGLVLLDHVIVTENSFYSLKASGLLSSSIERR
jgi:DNA repair protein RadC